MVIMNLSLSEIILVICLLAYYSSCFPLESKLHESGNLVFFCLCLYLQSLGGYRHKESSRRILACNGQSINICLINEWMGEKNHFTCAGSTKPLELTMTKTLEKTSRQRDE